MAGVTNQPPVLRFAPSPNGHLHLGHAYSALLNQEEARRLGGRLILRIEDIDVTRCRPDYDAALREDLAWLGLEWEEPVRRQSEHFADYRAALHRLAAKDLLYRSYASRSQIAAVLEDRHGWLRDPDGTPLYPRQALQAVDAPGAHAEDAPFALRLDMARALAGADEPLAWREREGTGKYRQIAARPELWGDVVLARKEFPASYHLAVVVDDALQGISHVIRGQDLYQATAVHRLLQVLLGLPALSYHHHGLIHGPDDRKLSKSLRSTSLRSLRAEGATPADIRRLVGLERFAS